MKTIKNDPAEYRTRDGFAKSKASDGVRAPVRLSRDQRDKLISTLGQAKVRKTKHIPFGYLIRK